MKSRYRMALPLLVISTGLYSLIGCIPIPTTQQYMTNGKLKPSHSIGKRSSDPVQLGVTPAEIAIERLSRVMTATDANVRSEETEYQRIRANWVQIDDRHFAIPYSKRTMNVVYPLCMFMSQPEERTEFLVLETDAQGRVTNYRTQRDRPSTDAGFGRPVFPPTQAPPRPPRLGPLPGATNLPPAPRPNDPPASDPGRRHADWTPVAPPANQPPSAPAEAVPDQGRRHADWNLVPPASGPAPVEPNR